MMRALLHWIVKRLPAPRVIFDRSGVSPYLSRYYILGRPKSRDGGAAFDETGQPSRHVVWPTSKIGVYLHKFHRGDEDSELHSHPWAWSVSFILSGGYREERRVGTWAGDGVVVREMRPWRVNIIRGSDFHRVDLYEDEAWSLFIAGPKASSWSFWDRVTGELTPWREFITRKRGPGWVES